MAIEWADLQGIVVRGTGYPQSYHIFFSLPDRATGNQFLRWIRPRITTAVPLPREVRSESLLFFGIAYPGLRLLGVETLLKRINENLRTRLQIA